MQFTPSRTRPSSVFSQRGAIGVTIAFSTALLAGCQADSVAGAPPDSAPHRVAQAELAAATIQPLWSELAPVNGVLIGTPAGAVITPANDFVVPPRTVWNVSSIVIRGVEVVATPSVTVSLAFRANGVGQPGAVIQRVTLTVVSKTAVDQTTQSDFRFDLAQPLTLGAGTYWLESQCSASLIECGLGPVVGQQAFTTTDDGATWTPGFPTADGPADNLFALLGTADTPESRIAELQATVLSFALDRGTETRLEAKLQTALVDIGSGDFTGACGAMQEFLDLASAKTGKKLTSAQAAALIAAATGVRALIGC
jgi:hypothetical protein